MKVLFIQIIFPPAHPPASIPSPLPHHQHHAAHTHFPPETLIYHAHSTPPRSPPTMQQLHFQSYPRSVLSKSLSHWSDLYHTDTLQEVPKRNYRLLGQWQKSQNFTDKWSKYGYWELQLPAELREMSIEIVVRCLWNCCTSMILIRHLLLSQPSGNPVQTESAHKYWITRQWENLHCWELSLNKTKFSSYELTWDLIRLLTCKGGGGGKLIAVKAKWCRTVTTSGLEYCM